MHRDVTSHDLNGTASSARLDKLPDTCPICHRSVHPNLVTSRHELAKKWLQVTFQCTHHSCQSLFISTYAVISQNGGARIDVYYLSSAPINATHHQFPEIIQETSPNFCLIFSQVEHAEAEQLDQLVGIGLRKSLEFLVKDFAISENPEKAEAIQKTMLGPCIDQFINDQNVKQCAKRATWLGNDETHYVRKWLDKDIADLKLLVKLTVNWLENYLLTKKYIADMSPEA